MVKGGLMDTYKQQIKGVEGQGAGAIPKKICGSATLDSICNDF